MKSLRSSLSYRTYLRGHIQTGTKKPKTAIFGLRLVQTLENDPYFPALNQWVTRVVLNSLVYTILVKNPCVYIQLHSFQKKLTFVQRGSEH